MTTQVNKDVISTLDHIKSMLKANIPYIWVNTYEEDRFIETLYGEILIPLSRETFTWSAHQGIVPYDPELPYTRAKGEMEQTTHPQRALDAINDHETSKNSKGTVFVMKDFHTVLQQPIPRQMRDLYTKLSNQKKCMIMVSPILAHGPMGQKGGIEPTLEKQITVLSYELPTKAFIESRIIKMLGHLKAQVKGNIKSKIDYTAEEINQFAIALQGLTELEIAQAMATSMTHLKELNHRFLLSQKRQIIQRSEILEYIGVTPSIDDVGGLDLAKKYFETYKDQFTPEAEAFGVDPLKGVLLTGLPGAGKSLLVKAVASVWHLPLLRLDVGKVMGSLVGSSIRGYEEIIWFDEERISHRNTISELVANKPKKCWVPTYNDEGKMIYAEVSQFIKHKIDPNNPLFEIEIAGGRKISATKDHCVFTYDDKLNLKDVTIRELSPGDYIAMPKKLMTFPNNQNRGTREEGFLAGAWLGNGDYNGKDVRYHLNNKDIKDFTDLLVKLNMSFSIYNSSSSNEAKVIHVRNNLRKKLESQGFIGDCYTKRVPEFAYGMSLDYITGLISGYFSTDGNFSGHVLENSSASYNLSKDIVNLMTYVGIYAFLAKKSISTKQFHTDLEHYTRIQISGREDLQIFRDKIGFIQDYKNKELDEYININSLETDFTHGVYVPQTNIIKEELKLLRRTQYNQFGYRLVGINNKSNAIGLNSLKKILKYDYPILGSQLKYNAPISRKALEQEIRWVQITNIKQIENYNDEYVYDISVPGQGKEKFLAGNPIVLVHNSEERMRQVVSQVEAIAPACLWIDEIEKSLSGTKSSNQSDGGTMARVFGTLLTAMEERMKDVVVLACIDGKTVIQLSNGQMCLAKDIQTTHNLLSTNFLTGKTITTQPTFKVNPIAQILYTIETTTSRLSCSYNHPFFIINKNGELLEIAAENLTAGMFAAAPLLIPEPENQEYICLDNVIKTHGNQKTVNLPKQLEEKLAYLVGYTTGDGGKSGRPNQLYPDRIGWNDCDNGMIKIIQELSSSLFQTECKIYNKRESGTITHYAYIDSNILGEWFHKNFETGLRAKGPNRSIPINIQMSNNSVVSKYISGLYDAEGWVTGQGNEFAIEWITTSYTMVQQLSLLLRRFGIYATLTSGFFKSSFTNNMIYRLHINDYDQQKLFYQLINFKHPSKKEKLEKHFVNFEPKRKCGFSAANIPIPIDLINTIVKQCNITLKTLRGLNSIKSQSKNHTVTINRNLFQEWINVLKTLLPENDSNLLKLIRLTQYQWDRVKSVSSEKKETPVYDFHIPEFHNYIAGGLFVHNTANDIQALPPELIRRFNEIFFVDLPRPTEREEIFKIHLRKRKRDIEKLNLNIDELITLTHLFTGSEIEKSIKEGIARAFQNKRKDVIQEDLVGAIKSTKPIAKVMSEQINAIREWAREKARYASSLAAAAAAPSAQVVTTSGGTELDLNSDLDDLDEAILTKREQEKKAAQPRELELEE